MCKVAANKAEQDAMKQNKPQSNENNTLLYVIHFLKFLQFLCANQ